MLSRFFDHQRKIDIWPAGGAVVFFLHQVQQKKN